MEALVTLAMIVNFFLCLAWLLNGGHIDID